MPKIELTPVELLALDNACKALHELVRKFRRYQTEAAVNGELFHAECHAMTAKRLDDECLALRALHDRASGDLIESSAAVTTTQTPRIPQNVRIVVAPVSRPGSPVYGCMPFILRAYDHPRTGNIMWRGDYYPDANYTAARLAAERECGLNYWHITNPIGLADTNADD